MRRLQADNHASTNGNGNINVNANINGNPGGISCGSIKPSSKVGVVGGGACKLNERNDHLRNERKNQDGVACNETNPTAAGCRPRTSKEAAHENVVVVTDRKLDGADPISGEYYYFRHRLLSAPLTGRAIALSRKLFTRASAREGLTYARMSRIGDIPYR